MGKNSILTDKQRIILEEISRNRTLCDRFYFSGDTALSELYLQHRYSDDFDFFSLQKFDQRMIFSFLTELSKKLNISFNSQFIEPVYSCTLKFPGKYLLKLDWAYYPYKQLEKGGKFNNLEVDSLLDISVNKLLTITQRAEVKDFVDLFFLLKKFTVWDLIEGVKSKFKMETEPLTLASHFILAEDFDFLPRMIVPLTLTDLKNFFLLQAKSLGKTAVK